jgi:antitoxin component of MazEF toxin-antitoxin module
MKLLYALQPYEVGSKNGKSLAIIIPAKVAKRYNVDISTVFTLRVDEDRKQIMLQTLNEIMDNRKKDTITTKTTTTAVAGQRLEAPVRQMPSPLARESNK